MSGIGSSSCTIRVDRNRRSAVKTGFNHFRQSVNATISGHSPTNAENIALFLLHGNALVANGGVFAASGANAVGSIETNTTELASALANSRTGASRVLTMRIWDGNSAELIASGLFEIYSVAELYGTDSGAEPVSPVDGTTVIWGKLAYYGGATYGKNDTDGLWYPLTFQGAGGLIHLDLGTTGITITP